MIRLWYILAMLLVMLPAVGCTVLDDASDTKQQPLIYTSNAETAYILDKEVLHKLGLTAPEVRPLKVPDSEWGNEPYVLALSTRSKVPGLLLLDAPWVHYYGGSASNNGNGGEEWLQPITMEDQHLREAVKQMQPSLREAFEASGSGNTLMALPTGIKGNVLFYRRDLIAKNDIPKTWDHLMRVARDKLADPRNRKNGLKYGILFHLDRIDNDFYPILWGHGVKIREVDRRPALYDKVGDSGLLQPKQGLIQALTMFKELFYPRKGPRLAPSPEEYKRFRQPRALREAFFRGEALFMINWNSRLKDLADMAAEARKSSQPFISPEDIGVAPIPHAVGHDYYYSNIGSFAWGVNRNAMASVQARKQALQFLRVLASKEAQQKLMYKFGIIPARTDMGDEVPEHLREVYQLFHGNVKVKLWVRPHRRAYILAFNECLMQLLRNQDQDPKKWALELCQQIENARLEAAQGQ